MPLIQVGICAGMTPSIVHALSSANIRNLTDFIAADLENLALVTEISYKVTFFFFWFSSLLMSLSKKKKSGKISKYNYFCLPVFKTDKDGESNISN